MKQQAVEQQAAAGKAPQVTPQLYWWLVAWRLAVLSIGKLEPEELAGDSVKSEAGSGSGSGAGAKPVEAASGSLLEEPAVEAAAAAAAAFLQRAAQCSVHAADLPV